MVLPSHLYLSKRRGLRPFYVFNDFNGPKPQAIKFLFKLLNVLLNNLLKILPSRIPALDLEADKAKGMNNSVTGDLTHGHKHCGHYSLKQLETHFKIA